MLLEEIAPRAMESPEQLGLGLQRAAPSLSLLWLLLCPESTGTALLSTAEGTLSLCQLSALLPAEITVLFANRQTTSIAAAWLGSGSDFLSQAA